MAPVGRPGDRERAEDDERRCHSRQQEGRLPDSCQEPVVNDGEGGLTMESTAGQYPEGPVRDAYAGGVQAGSSWVQEVTDLADLAPDLDLVDVALDRAAAAVASDVEQGAWADGFVHVVSWCHDLLWFRRYPDDMPPEARAIGLDRMGFPDAATVLLEGWDALAAQKAAGLTEKAPESST